MLPISPPRLPSTVLLGLIEGASLFLPIPTNKISKVSVDHVTKRANKQIHSIGASRKPKNIRKNHHARIEGCKDGSKNIHNIKFLVKYRNNQAYNCKRHD